MSTDLEELIRLRFREELKRLHISVAEAGRIMGEITPSRFKDILGGRTRMPTKVLADAVIKLGMDGSYVLTGQRSFDVDVVRKLMTRANDLSDLIDQEITAEQKVEIVCSVLKTSQHLGEEVDQQAFIAALHAVAGD